MPLVHVTSVYRGRQIVEIGRIETRLCPVFDTQLCYFFALTVAYRPKGADAKSEEVNRFPFAFVVVTDKRKPPFHVYPFDTGGFVGAWFGDQSRDRPILGEYELDPDLAAAAKHIGWAFDSARSYFDGDVRSDLLNGVADWLDVIHTYAKIARLAGHGDGQPDRRASAVEVAYSDHVSLKDHGVLAIIPKQYLENGTGKNEPFLKRLAELGIRPVPYDWKPNTSPDDYQSDIRDLAELYFSRIGAL